MMPEPTINGWTVNTLKEHVETLIKEHDRRYEERFTAQGVALDKALRALNDRLDLLNELRGNVLTTDTFEARHAMVTGEIDALRDRINRQEGAETGVNLFKRQGIAVAALAVSVVAMIVTYLALHH